MPMEVNLLIVREVAVFSLPPRSATGFRAQEWEGKQIWKGRLRITTETLEDTNAASKLFIKLEEPDGTLFAQCEYNAMAVEPVVDSSRYFVLKITDEKSN